MPAGKRKPYRPTCACGAVKVDGWCTASPSCSDFGKPHRDRLRAEAAAAKRERQGDSIGIDRAAVRAAAIALVPEMARRSAQAVGRARRALGYDPPRTRQRIPQP